MRDQKIRVIFLVDFQIVSTEKMLRSRRKRNNIIYRIIEPCLVTLLETDLRLVDDAKEKKQEPRDEQRASRARRNTVVPCTG